MTNDVKTCSNPSSFDNLNSMKLDLNVSIKVKFSANDQGL